MKFQLYDILERQTMETVKRWVVSRSCGEREVNGGMEGLGSETVLYDTTLVDPCHQTFVKTHIMCNTTDEP